MPRGFCGIGALESNAFGVVEEPAAVALNHRIPSAAGRR